MIQVFGSVLTKLRRLRAAPRAEDLGSWVEDLPVMMFGRKRRRKVGVYELNSSDIWLILHALRELDQKGTLYRDEGGNLDIRTASRYRATMFRIIKEIER